MGILTQEDEVALSTIEEDLRTAQRGDFKERDRLLNICDLILDRCALSPLVQNIRYKILITFDGTELTTIENLDMNDERSRRIAEVLTAIAPHGKIVYERAPAIPYRRICILVKQNHSTLEKVDFAVKHPDFARMYLEHQAHLVGLQRNVDSLTGHRMHLFVEDLTVGAENTYLKNLEEDLQGDRRGSLERVETSCLKAAENKKHAQQIFERLQLYIANGENVSAEECFHLMRGEQRYIRASMASGISWEGRLHGIATAKRRARQKKEREQGPMEFNPDEMFEDFIDIHTNLGHTMAQKVSVGETAVVCLGGAHHKYGTRLFTQEVDIPSKFFDAATIESILEKTPGLEDTYIMTVDPHIYAELTNFHHSEGKA